MKVQPSTSIRGEMLKDLEVLHPLCQKAEASFHQKWDAERFRSAASSLSKSWTWCESHQKNCQDDPSGCQWWRSITCTDEWKIYLLQYIPESWYREAGSEEYNLINHYWRKVLQKKNFLGSVKYTILPKCVKTCICLAQRNAHVECPFFIRKQKLSL